MRVLLAGGGTAGHVEPALAVADALRRRGHDVWLLGTVSGAEAGIVPARGHRLLTIDKVPFPRTVNAAALTFPARALRAVLAARRHLRDRRIDVVIGFGGYAAGAAYAAARSAGIPIVVFSYDAAPGIANRVAARWTRWCASGVASSHPAFARAIVTGIPLKPAIRDLDRVAAAALAREEFGLREGQPTLVVFGGSLGAARINAALLGCADRVLAAGWQVVHITGARDADALAQSRVLESRPGWRVRDYVGDMSLAYAVADFVVSRAGAMTCAELTATGVPALLIPYAVGNGEQAHNARPLVDSGGYLLLADSGADPEALWSTLQPVLDGRELAGITARAHAWRDRHERLDAAERLADVVERAAS